MTKSTSELYANPREVEDLYCIKQGLRLGGLGTATVLTAVGTYNSTIGQDNEKILEKCVLFAGAGLAAWLYSHAIKIFKTADNKEVASLSDIVNF